MKIISCVPIKVLTNINHEPYRYRILLRPKREIKRKLNLKDMSTIAKLADIIEANPNCQVTIDNDCWWIVSDGEEIASSSEFNNDEGKWYTEHYGGTVAVAFAELLNRRGFNIHTEAV